jgi:hypothetical protein
MNRIQQMSTEYLKYLTENMYKNFCTEESLVTGNLEIIEPRTFTKDDFTKGSIVYQIFEEYEKRLVNA